MSGSTVQRLLHPRAVAVVGASDDPSAIGGAPVYLLERFGYSGDVHLVSQSRDEVGGRRCVPSIDDLPSGVDAVVLAIPKAGVPAAVAAARRRSVGAIVVFSSGYGELGDAGLAEQMEIAAAAKQDGIAMAGPNCAGLVNFVEGIPLTFGHIEPNRRNAGPGLAIIAQSGAMCLALAYAAQGQDIRINFAISTGNEAVVGIEDYLDAVLEEESTRAVALLVEQIRRPAEFRALAAKAREREVGICILHTGRSERAQAAVRAHTGAIPCDQDCLRAVLAHEGVLFIDSVDELVDTAGLLTKAPMPSSEGIAFMTDSGAAKTIALDLCGSMGLPLPDLSAAATEMLARELPPFAPAVNPTDITAMGLNDPTLYARVLNALLTDERTGTVVVATMPGQDVHGGEQVGAFVPAMEAATKPVVYTLMGDGSPLPDADRMKVLDAGIPLFRSVERALRAVRDVGLLAKRSRAASSRRLSRPDVPVLSQRRGEVGDLQAKRLLAAAGLVVSPAKPLVGEGLEMIIRARRDPKWGPYVAVRLGGACADLVDDNVVVPADLGPAEVLDVLAGLKAFPVLSGARGGCSRDLEALAGVVEILAALMVANPDVVDLEVSPLLLLKEGDGAIVVDASISLAPPNAPGITVDVGA